MITLQLTFDDFLIVAKDAWPIMKHMQTIYLIKNPAYPEIYLAAKYRGSPAGDWMISCKLYIKEAIQHIERLLDGSLRTEKSPMVTGDHPEQDESSLLDNEWHRIYQQLIGMALWVLIPG